MSVSAHKLYGPKGVGALYVRRRPRVRLAPQIDGGGHESGLRSGTLERAWHRGLRRGLRTVPHGNGGRRGAPCGAARSPLGAFSAELEQVAVNGSIGHRLPHNLNVRFTGVDSESLLMALPEIALSTGSACTSATVSSRATCCARSGMGDDAAHSSVRFGLGRTTTEDEIDYAASRLVAGGQAPAGAFARDTGDAPGPAHPNVLNVFQNSGQGSTQARQRKISGCSRSFLVLHAIAICDLPGRRAGREMRLRNARGARAR